jgi:hypothetical protein
MSSSTDSDAADAMEKRLPHVRSSGDVKRHDGSRVIAEGRYEAIARPRKGGPASGAPHELAVVVLDDGTRVYLEPIDAESAVRSRDERQRWDGQQVQVAATIHGIMPSRGQSLIAPCLSEVQSISAR